MTKKRIITFVIATLLASALFYVIATRFAPTVEVVETEEVTVDNSAKCIQCEYLPEGTQQEACFEDYGCR